MPRIARAIAVGYPHHITQRANYRQTVFEEAEDYAHYLELVTRYSRKYELEIWAYCLMPNHVHIIGVPRADTSLSSVFRNVNMLYSQFFNRKANNVGHLWQGRFYSCALDERYLYAAIRYVEINPVRAGLVTSAADYPWSSAKSHITGTPDPVLSGSSSFEETIPDWKEFLLEPPDTDAQDSLRKSTKTGRPCGSNDFVAHLEDQLGRRFAVLPPGRPPNIKIQEADVEK